MVLGLVKEKEKKKKEKRRTCKDDAAPEGRSDTEQTCLITSSLFSWGNVSPEMNSYMLSSHLSAPMHKTKSGARLRATVAWLPAAA